MWEPNIRQHGFSGVPSASFYEAEGAGDADPQVLVLAPGRRGRVQGAFEVGAMLVQLLLWAGCAPLNVDIGVQNRDRFSFARPRATPAAQAISLVSKLSWLQILRACACASL